MMKVLIFFSFYTNLFLSFLEEWEEFLYGESFSESFILLSNILDAVFREPPYALELS
jgi:hypothetical protein